MLYINGRFLTQPMSGVQRYATEILTALNRIILHTPDGGTGLPPMEMHLSLTCWPMAKGPTKWPSPISSNCWKISTYAPMCSTLSSPLILTIFSSVVLELSSMTVLRWTPVRLLLRCQIDLGFSWRPLSAVQEPYESFLENTCRMLLQTLHMYWLVCYIFKLKPRSRGH